MEDEIIQPSVKTRKRDLSPEKELLRRFGKLPRVKLPNFEAMDKKDIIKWIDQHYRSKEVILGFIKSLYLVEQQMYFEASERLTTDSSTLSFQILEGEVTIDFSKPEDSQYLFKPNKTLENLINKTDQKGKTIVIEFNYSRFFKMIETLYKVYH